MKNLFKKIIVFKITLLAKVVLAKYKPKIVAVTGSVGKTSTKDAIYTVLSSEFFVRKSEKSFNSDIGVPLTILGCHNGWSNPFLWARNILRGVELVLFKNTYPQWLVLEVGADYPGDIKNITKWLFPDVVVVTRFGEVPVHVENFKSRAELIAEKGYLVHALKKEGALILNHDDHDTMKFKEKAKAKCLTFGMNIGADVVSSNVSVVYDKNDEKEFPKGLNFKINVHGNCLPVILDHVLGEQHILPVLAGVAVGISQQMNLVKITEALDTHIPPRGRMNLISGIKNTVLIDDTYNASPVATSQALETLKNLHISGRKMVVLGDMLELGKFSAEEHKKVGVQAVSFADIFVPVGLRMQGAKEGALSAGMDPQKIFEFEDSECAGQFLQQQIQSGDVVLIKGSQGMRMERAVLEVMAHPEQREALLVRQEPEWQKR
ncbi:UDP-N-acetylmuramoyl-tripeptide--D-alanyl-D-alanine ligase [Patescibacteria group bacterium]|nr:MAG: UDP-N-acetylmuramoyl-tripeptide--D-alanyl-D-alanine ligase [Patescibacteria group bacterium]